jgi:hypothetical protein
MGQSYAHPALIACKTIIGLHGFARADRPQATRFTIYQSR